MPPRGRDKGCGVCSGVGGATRTPEKTENQLGEEEEQEPSQVQQHGQDGTKMENLT